MYHVGMSGFASKRMISKERRHCDSVTMDHIIDLKKQLREMERQRDNAVERCVALDNLVWKLRAQLIQSPEGNPTNDEERNC